jgi:hypothetical protein
MNLIIKILDMIPIIKEETILSIRTIRKINEGSYGIIYLTNYNNLVIKIIKHSSMPNFINEVSIFYKLKKIDNNDYPSNLIKYIGFGKIVNCDKHKFIKCNVLFMKEYNNFYDLYPELKLVPLIFFEDYKKFIIIFITKLLKINYFFEEKLESANIDIKLNNILSHNNDILLIDLGMLVKLDKTYIDNKTYNDVWPSGKTEIKYIPNYSIGKIIVNLLFHNKRYSIQLDNEINIILKLLLSGKYDTQYVLNFIKEHYEEYLL